MYPCFEIPVNVAACGEGAVPVSDEPLGAETWTGVFEMGDGSGWLLVCTMGDVSIWAGAGWLALTTGSGVGATLLDGNFEKFIENLFLLNVNELFMLAYDSFKGG